MKKIFTILGVAAVSLLSAQTNLVQNPSFEEGLAPWAAGFNTSYTAPTVKTGDAQDGNNYVAYEGATGTTGFYQNVPIDAEKQYTLSFWYKATGDGTDARIWSGFQKGDGSFIYLTANNDAANDPLRSNNSYLDPAEDWTQKTIVFTSPAEVVAFQCHFRAYRNSTVVAFDNISLVEGNLSTVDFSKDKYSLVKNALVESTLVFAKSTTAKIINVNGQVVKTIKANDGDSVDVSSLAKGIYIVTGEVDGKAVNQKIIKK